MVWRRVEGGSKFDGDIAKGVGGIEYTGTGKYQKDNTGSY